MEVETTKFVNTGFTIAQVVPIALSIALGFHSERSSHAVDLAFAWIPSFFCYSALVLFASQVFLQSRFDDCFSILDAKQPSSSMPLLANRRNNPTGKFMWVNGSLMVCAVVQFVTHFLSMFLMPFLTYFGDAQLAHILVLTRFGGEMLGRIASHYWGFSFSECLKDHGPTVLSWLVVLRFIILTILMLGVFHFLHLGHGLLLKGLVGFFYFVFARARARPCWILLLRICLDSL
jgi:hypothetical protein